MTPKERLLQALRAKRQSKPLVDWLFNQRRRENQEEMPPAIPAVELLTKMEELGGLHAELDRYLAQRGPRPRLTIDHIEARLMTRIEMLQEQIERNRQATLDWGNLNLDQLHDAARRFNIDITAVEGEW